MELVKTLADKIRKKQLQNSNKNHSLRLRAVKCITTTSKCIKKKEQEQKQSKKANLIFNIKHNLIISKSKMKQKQKQKQNVYASTVQACLVGILV